jgi:hypothetical protein
MAAVDFDRPHDAAVVAPLATVALSRPDNRAVAARPITSVASGLARWRRRRSPATRGAR